MNDRWRLGYYELYIYSIDKLASNLSAIFVKGYCILIVYVYMDEYQCSLAKAATILLSIL